MSTSDKPAFGMTLSAEEHPPSTLVDLAAKAEEAGFDFVSVSDHFHPWMEEQGHSPFVWSVLGGIGVRTEQIQVAVGVTCPIVRIHPAIVAHAAATTSLLLDGRFVFGVGTGEALNEHVLGHRWPRAEIRREMLVEAVEIMRALWTGENLNHRGEYYEVENARLFDPPAEAIPVIVSGFGPEAVTMAAEIGDGYWGHSPEREMIERFEADGGSGPRYSQINLCWAKDEASARQTVHKVWPNGAVKGQLSQDLPTWNHFEQAAEMVTEDDAVENTPCGPDVEPVVEQVRQFLDAGFDHLYFHQIGPDQEGFLKFWADELSPALSELTSERS